MRAAIDVEHFPRHKCCIRQIEYRVDNLRHFPDPLNWMERLQEPVCLRLVHRRIDDPGANRVEPDPGVSKLDGQRRRNRVQPPFGEHRNGCRHPGNWLISQRRRDIYDMAFARLADLKGRAIARDRTLAIGDGLRTDIAGAAAAGVPSIYIASSVHMKPGESLDGTTLARLFNGLPTPPIAAMPNLSW